MIDSVNTSRPTTRTLAVIDGGLNVKARRLPASIQRETQAAGASPPGHPNPAL